MATPKIPENADQEISAIQSDVKSELPSSNPWLKWSQIRAETIGLGRRTYALYFQLNNMFNSFFVNTSRSVWRDMWASFRNISPSTESSSSGNITATGTAASTIDAGETLTIGNFEYETTDSATITAKTITISSLTRSGITATATTSTDHELASGMSVPISGATETDWNNTFSNIVVTDSNEFTFTVDSSLTTPVTGSPQVDVNCATVAVQCTSGGVLSNQDSGAVLYWDNEITGVDETAAVQYGGLTGGVDADDEDDINSGYNQRINDAFAEPLTLFNPEHIKRTIMDADASNTRVWVHKIWNDDTSAEEEGCVTAYFVRDNDASPIPDSAEEAAAKAAVVAIATGNTSEDDIFVLGPTAKTVNVEISGVSPLTTSMYNAISNQIDSWFSTHTNEGEDMSVDQFNGFIGQTYDAESGTRLTTYTRVSPSIDQTCVRGEIPVKGTVSIS